MTKIKAAILLALLTTGLAACAQTPVNTFAPGKAPATSPDGNDNSFDNDLDFA